MDMTSTSINSIPQKSNRAERTPGEVAVSLNRAEGPGEPGPSPISALLAGQTQGGGGTDSYLDTIANVSFEAKNALHKLNDSINVSGWLSSTCEKKGWFVAGECANGHRFAKELVCGKEWCSVCGEDGSVAHNRRFARWLKKAQQMESVGYFVFTIPVELRSEYRTKKALRDFGHKVQEALKAQGYTRGLRRWHFFGDKSTKYHPHLNVLVDAGYISPEKLDTVKRAYAVLLGIDMADVNYHYRLSPGKIVHSLKYVTRATFRDYELDIELALELRNFRNMVSWGRGQWGGEAVWSLSDLGVATPTDIEGLNIEAINSLAEKKCPVCGEPVKWGEALPIGLLSMVEKESLGAGYYRLKDVRSPPELPAAVKLKLHWMELLHRVEVRQAQERAEARAKAEAEEYQSWWDSLVNKN
ncbi:hypothetical protein ES705_31176 [subsurface metagenome]